MEPRKTRESRKRILNTAFVVFVPFVVKKEVKQ